MSKSKSEMKDIRKKMGYYAKYRQEPPIQISFTIDDAVIIAKALKIDFSKEKFDLNQFTDGLNVELEHGSRFPETNITKNDPIITGKIAWAHLKEYPDYYTRLKKLEDEAKEYWKDED